MYHTGRVARMERHHGRHKGEAAINLVSMIDMLTVLVFFLLVYSTEIKPDEAAPIFAGIVKGAAEGIKAYVEA